jgi:hypothetical protein
MSSSQLTAGWQRQRKEFEPVDSWATARKKKFEPVDSWLGAARLVRGDAPGAVGARGGAPRETATKFEPVGSAIQTGRPQNDNCRPERLQPNSPLNRGWWVYGRLLGGRLTFPARFSSQLTAQVARQGGARAVACLGEGEGGRFGRGTPGS